MEGSIREPALQMSSIENKVKQYEIINNGFRSLPFMILSLLLFLGILKTGGDRLKANTDLLNCSIVKSNSFLIFISM